MRRAGRLHYDCNREFSRLSAVGAFLFFLSDLHGRDACTYDVKQELKQLARPAAHLWLAPDRGRH